LLKNVEAVIGRETLKYVVDPVATERKDLIDLICESGELLIKPTMINIR